MINKKFQLSENIGKQFHFNNDFWEKPLKCGFIDLYQIGEICCESGFKIEEHAQSVYEISYIISGHGYLYVDDDKIKITEGDILINSIGYKHSMEADDSSILRFAYIGFLFNKNAGGGEYEELKDCYKNTSYHIGKDNNDVLLMFMRCMDEFYSKTIYKDHMIKNYCEQIVIMTARIFMEDTETPIIRKSENGIVSSAVYSVIRYVEKNICTINNIGELAKNLGYNYTYLSHFFKNKTGISLQKYISYKKIEYAVRLMKYEGFSATQASEHLNYESIQSFSKAFNRVMGVSPTKYMKKERTENFN